MDDRRKFRTQYPGVRYREHKVRKHIGLPDRYFFIRWRNTEERVGWASDGWNARKAADLLSIVRRNQAIGEGPQSLGEMRRVQEEARAKREAEKKRLISLGGLLIDHYLPHVKRRKRSWRDDFYRINRINSFLGHLPLPDVSPENLEGFKARLEDSGLAPATVLQYLGLIRSAFNFAIRTKIDGVFLFEGANPVKSVELPRPKGRRERFLSPAELDALVEAAAEFGWLDLRDAIVLSVNTGMRYGEIVRLEWSDVDLVHGVITVRHEEHRKPGGPCYINADTRAVFDGRERVRGEPRVFPPPNGGFMKNGSITREDISKQFAKVAKRIGLNRGVTDSSQQVVFHTLRHTFASWLALNGTDIFRIKTLMRHETISMTMRYAHLIPDATRGAVENIRPKQ
ncbi:tyrosine-type recombinase/integrase [Desulfoluna butyratoxydans]|uniref:Integrase catalytic domain n=1 Tax=Desulfoluna butyratoxydans TaxID=231438 RepID=A0A4U8YRE7_9BACT|nr:site-specific integrase [Desulfoluna butyratoxydans]VFQ44362.1 integrase catalytic domain [Desulfoluna butyratoxydans]